MQRTPAPPDHYTWNGNLQHGARASFIQLSYTHCSAHPPVRSKTSQVETLHAGPVGKLEAAAGARRIRRTITHTLPSGEKAIREIIFTDQEKVGLQQPCVWRSFTVFCLYLARSAAFSSQWTPAASAASVLSVAHHSTVLRSMGMLSRKFTREVPLQMALLNALYGDPTGGFGVRTVTVSSSAVTLQPSPLPKPKKSGKRTSARCTACGEVCSFLDFHGNNQMQNWATYWTSHCLHPWGYA